MQSDISSWNVVDLGFAHQPRVYDSHGTLICCVGNAEDYLSSYEGWEDNARLIAAAPALQHAANIALGMLETWIIDQLEGTASFDREMAKLKPIRDALALVPTTDCGQKVGGLQT